MSMRPQRAMSAFMMLAILLASSMGCIGLVPAREVMEELRGSAEINLQTEKVNISHTFITDVTNLSTINYDRTKSFEVTSEVTEIRAYIKADMVDLVDIIFQIPPESRFVNATLVDGNGDVVWEESLTETETKIVATFQQPLAVGTWNLIVESRGYGENTAGVAQDSFQVIINIERQCWIYPTEDECSYD